MNELKKIENPLAEVDTLTAEINIYKQQAGACIVEIGRRLLRAKELLPHGGWAEWLAHKVEFSERTAQNFMKVAKEYENPQPVADLGLSKALLLLQIPENERDNFLTEPHPVGDTEKTVQEMSKRELEKVIKERDEARKQAETALSDVEKWKNTADAKEISMQNAKRKAEEQERAAEAARDDAKRQAEEYDKIVQKADALAEKMQAMEAAAKAEPLRAEVVPDEETLQKIRAEILAEQADALEAANARAAEAAAKLEKARNPAALRVNLWFADLQNLVQKIEPALMEMHAQQPETAYKFRDTIAGFLAAHADSLRGGLQ